MQLSSLRQGRPVRFLLPTVLIVGVMFFLFVSQPLLFREWGCDSSEWIEAEMEGIIVEILQKRGGLPRLPHISFAMGSDDYPVVSPSEAVLDWRLTSSAAYVDNRLREPDYNLRATVEVIYTDGHWREIQLSHERAGFVPICQLPPIQLTDFRAPYRYKTLRSDAEQTVIVKEVDSLAVEPFSFNYRIIQHPENGGRIITFHPDDTINVENFERFAEANEALARQLIGLESALDVQLLFETPIPLITAQNIVTERFLTAEILYVQSQNHFGDSIIWPIHVSEYDHAALAQRVDQSRFSQNDPYMPFGVNETIPVRAVGIAGQIPASNFDGLASELDIALVDVTPTLLRRELQNDSSMRLSQHDFVANLPLLELVTTVNP